MFMMQFIFVDFWLIDWVSDMELVDKLAHKLVQSIVNIFNGFEKQTAEAHLKTLTLKRQNRRGLNLSFPFLSSRDKYWMN